MRFVMGNQNTVLLEASCTGNLRKVQQALDRASASDVNRKGQDAWTPLHYAACNGHLSITEALLQHGADANATEKLGRTPLHLAARNGNTEVLASLVSARAVVDITDDEGMTPLALAAAKGHTLAAGELIWGQADVNAVVQDGASALHHAASHGHTAVVQLLLQKGADPNAQDSDGYTPLMETAAQGHLPVAKQLLRAHADTAMVNKEGRSASAVAHAEGHAEMAELLMCQTGRPHTRTNTSASQPSETPSAPPWAPAQATLHQPAPPQPTTPHASTLHHLGAPPQLARSASARPSSTAAGSGAAVAYPAVYPLSSLFSQQPSAEAIAETVGVSRPAAQPGHSGGSHGLQAQTVQVEAPRMGYVPAAVSFMMGKLQAALPDMLRAASAPVAGASAQASPALQHSQQHSQQHDQQYCGPYGLVEDEEDGDDVGEDGGHAEVPSGATLNDQLAAPQGQAHEEGGVRPGSAPAPVHGVPCMHPPPPHLRPPMCRLFRLQLSSQEPAEDHAVVDLACCHELAGLLRPAVAVSEITSSPLTSASRSSLRNLIDLDLTGLETASAPTKEGSLDGALRGEAPPGGGPSITMRLNWHLRIRLAAACADTLAYLHSHPSKLMPMGARGLLVSAGLTLMDPKLPRHAIARHAALISCITVLAHEHMDQGLTKHSAVQQPLFLRRFTASILLDKDLMPQLSRFALRPVSRFPQPADSEAEVVRTLGLIMLQLLTGRETAASLRQHVSKHLQRATLPEVLDPCSGSWPLHQAQRFASLAIRCTSTRPAEVPSLAESLVPQLTALAAEAAAAAAAEPAAATAPPVAASRRPARSEAEREPCSWFKCPISLDVMEDPVVAADGQTYDKACIQQWFDRGKRTSPYSGAPLLDTRLTPNYSIKSAISDWQQKQC